MGQVIVTKKEPQKYKSASHIEPLKSYRIVEFREDDRDKDKKESIGDILIAFPRAYGGVEVFNTQTGRLLNGNNGYTDRIICARDFDIHSITLTFDENERPA